MNYKKITIILILVSIALISLTYLLTIKKSTTTQPPNSISPTLSQSLPKSEDSNSLSPAQQNEPTLIAPTFTGASDEELPQDILELSLQKQELRNKTPLNEQNFTITFDFETDRFTVLLSEPTDISQTLFYQWLEVNYPAIPKDRFTFQ